MSELKASTVTESKIKNIIRSGVLDNAPRGATHYDMFWCQFLKAEDGALYVSERGCWPRSQHKDGVNMLSNGECLNLKSRQLEKQT